MRSGRRAPRERDRDHPGRPLPAEPSEPALTGSHVNDHYERTAQATAARTLQHLAGAEPLETPVVRRSIKIGGDTWGGDNLSRMDPGSPFHFRRELGAKLAEHGYGSKTPVALMKYLDPYLAGAQVMVEAADWGTFLEQQWEQGRLQRPGRGPSMGPKNLGDRPGWLTEVTAAMPLETGQHRRHVISSSTLGLGIEKAHQALVDQVPDGTDRLQALNDWLARHPTRGAAKGRSEPQALRTIWKVVHNHAGNLWAGEGTWNTAIGYLRSPLTGLCDRIRNGDFDHPEGPGRVDVPKILDAIDAMKPAFHSNVAQWQEILGVLRAVLEGGAASGRPRTRRSAGKPQSTAAADRVVQWLEEWIANADLDVPYGMPGRDSDYFIRLKAVYAQLQAAGPGYFDKAGPLDRFLALSHAGTDGD